jgi:hypothetical protein
MQDQRSSPIQAPAADRIGPVVPWVAGLCPVLALGMSVALIVIGWTMPSAGPVIAAAGALGVVLTVALLPVTIASARGAVRVSDARELSALREAIERVAEHQALSDDARRVLHRRPERDLLRRAIEEDIAAEDWDAAMVLVNELADRFGYRADAEEFRDRIEQARAETVRRRIEEGIARIDGLIVQRRWDQAAVEAARVARLHPDSPRVEGLRRRVDVARQAYKEDLERRFLHAARSDQADEALELLKELDGYLSEAEAQPYREVARDVIGKAREILGEQFKLAVQDKHWDRASHIGERIVREFPNTRMAGEVRELLEAVKTKANGVSLPAARAAS